MNGPPPLPTSLTIASDAHTASLSTQRPNAQRGAPRIRNAFRRDHDADQPGVPEKVAAQLEHTFDLNVYLGFFPSVTPAGRAYLEAAMDAPSRNPSGRRSTTTRYASLKFGHTLTAESDRAEMPAMLMADHTDDVLFALEQPPPFGLVYATGESTGSGRVTPDLILCTGSGPQIVECKMQTEVAKKCITQPARYQRSEDGTYRSDPANLATAEFGIPFRIVTESNYEGHFLRALVFLTPYFRNGLRQPISEEERTRVLVAIESDPGLTAAKIPIPDASRRADVVYSMIAKRELFAPLSDTNIHALDQLRLFRTPVEERAYALFCGRISRALAPAVPVARQLPPGAQFKIAHVEFTVIAHHERGVLVRNSRTSLEQEISYALLQESGVRFQLREEDMPTRDLLIVLGEERLKKFLRNRRLIEPYLPFGKFAGQTPNDRTTRRLLANYRAADFAPGGGDRALIPCVHKGCTTPRKSDNSEALLIDMIKEEFLKHAATSAANTYQRYVAGAERLHLPPQDRYTYRSVARRIAKLNRYVAALKREGKRVALKFRPPSEIASLLGPPNGLAPWATGHMDHTLIDVLVRNPATGEFDRPWISALVDGYDGRILAIYVWFGCPCTTTVFEVLKDCLHRHGVLPCKVRCDWGAEFRSRAVQVGLASVGISVSYRAKGEPRAGAPIETSFRGMNERMFHPLEGCTTILQNARDATAAVQPENFAIWRMKEFTLMIERYIVAYNQAPKEHSLPPDDIYSTFVAVHGVHCASWLSPELIDRLQQLPVNDNTRVVSKKATIRVRSADYTAPELQQLIGQEVRVFANKRDPRAVWFDHPKTRLRIACTCVTQEILYAGSAPEAEAIVDHRMDGSYRRVQDAHAIWAKFLDENRQLELAMRDDMRRELTSSARPALPESNPPALDLTKVSPAKMIVD